MQGLQEDGELVATQARHQVDGPHTVVQALGDFVQQLVAGHMAQAVVDHLEAIQIQEQHRKPLLGIQSRALNRHFQAFMEAIPIRQVGQAVVVGDVEQATLRQVARGNVVQLVDQALPDAGRILVAAAVHGHPALGTPDAQGAQLHREGLFRRIQHRACLALKRSDVPDMQQLVEWATDQLRTGAGNQRTKGHVCLLYTSRCV